MTHHMTHRSGAGTMSSTPSPLQHCLQITGVSRERELGVNSSTQFPEKALDTRQSPLRSQTANVATSPIPAVLCKLRLVCGTGG